MSKGQTRGFTSSFVGLGVPGRPVPLLTGSLLFIGEGLTNLRPGGRIPFDMPVEIATNSGGPWFRAYDKQTGETVWEIELEAGTTSPPVSYLHDGEQYLLVSIGDRSHSPEMLAFKLNNNYALSMNDCINKNNASHGILETQDKTKKTAGGLRA